MRKKPLAKARARAGSSSSKPLANKHRPRVIAIHGGEARRSAVAAAKLPAVENKHTKEGGHSITYELRPVLCGKPGCKRHHGPYWYAYWTQGGRVRTVYIGKVFQRVSAKCPEKLTQKTVW